jgi:hypothetical protein
MQALTLCGAKVVSTRTAVGQFKGQVQGRVQGGDGGNVWAGAEGEHTAVASLEYTLVLVSVAVP